MSETKQRLVVYVGPFSFPKGGAAAKRILGVSQSLVAANYKVVIASGQNECDSLPNGEFNGLDVYSLNERTAENYPALIKYFIYFGMGKKTLAWLDDLEQKPDAIILYSGYSPYFIRLLPWCKKNHIPLIFDAVEWYDPPSFLKGILNPYYWNIEFAMRYLSVKAKNIIVISKYLETYYKLKGCNTLRIPPTVNMKNIKARIESTQIGIITLGYVGSPGHKDLLNNILEALFDLDLNGERFQLKVAGICKIELLEYPALKKRRLNELPGCLESLGVIAQCEAMAIVRGVDFSVLLRPNKRYAKAGFPTKFVESFSLGTPVIANITSDLGDYLIDGKTGFICRDETPASLRRSLIRLLDLKPNELQEMRCNARASAVKHFDTSLTIEPINSFMKAIKPFGSSQ